LAPPPSAILRLFLNPTLAREILVHGVGIQKLVIPEARREVMSG
jgi:hypothetical protein